jgi:hypothetical protein
MLSRSGCHRPDARGCRRLAGRFDEFAGGFRLYLADGFLKRKALARDIRLVERRLDPAQLREQCRARTLIKGTAILAVVLLETGDSAGNERVVIGHRV